MVELPGIFNGLWDISADGERFLFVQESEAASTGTAGETTQSLVRFTFHWFEELRRLLATEN